jgi:hypothetical protein
LRGDGEWIKKVSRIDDEFRKSGDNFKNDYIKSLKELQGLSREYFLAGGVDVQGGVFTVLY